MPGQIKEVTIVNSPLIKRILALLGLHSEDREAGPQSAIVRIGGRLVKLRVVGVHDDARRAFGRLWKAYNASRNREG